jgi:formiminotetrahydrofolate cyclodeaminase
MRRPLALRPFIPSISARMTATQRLVDLSIAQFAQRLAERTATPGGGSVAAALAAHGAALAAMAFRFTSGEKYAAVEADMARRVEELDRLRARALELVDEDSRAYDAVSAAYKLPKGTDAEKSARGAAVQRALKSAVDIPYETMKTALAALALCAAGASDINRNLASDCATGALCLAAALESAWLNVRINAGSIQDAQFVAVHMQGGERMRGEARALGERVRAAVEKHLV